MKTKKSFIFLGVRLEALLAFQIFANLKYVITVKNSYVHKYVKKNKIKFFLIDHVNKEISFNRLEKEKNCKIIFSAGFPFILPTKVLNNFRLKLNSHPSLLPNFKGLSPIRDAYKKRFIKKIGVTIHEMINKVDSGKILHQEYIKKNDLKLNDVHQLIFNFIEPAVIIKGIQKIRL